MPYKDKNKSLSYCRTWSKAKRLREPKNERDKAKKRYERQRMRALMLLGGKCEKCDCNIAQLLQIDHIHSNGRSDKSTYSKSVHHLFKKINDYQLLCVNHNWVKRYEKSEMYAKSPNSPFMVEI